MNLRLSLLIFLLIQLFIIPCYSCSCLKTGSVVNEFKKSDFVLSGEIIDIERVSISKKNDPFSLNENKNAYKITLKVEDIFKGKKGIKTLNIYTGLVGGDCGFNFKKQNKYIIYGFKEKIKLQMSKNATQFYWTSVCTRTAIYDTNEKNAILKLK